MIARTARMSSTSVTIGSSTRHWPARLHAQDRAQLRAQQLRIATGSRARRAGRAPGSPRAAAAGRESACRRRCPWCGSLRGRPPSASAMRWYSAACSSSVGRLAPLEEEELGAQQAAAFGALRTAMHARRRASPGSRAPAMRDAVARLRAAAAPRRGRRCARRRAASTARCTAARSGGRRIHVEPAVLRIEHHAACRRRCRGCSVPAATSVGMPARRGEDRDVRSGARRARVQMPATRSRVERETSARAARRRRAGSSPRSNSRVDAAPRPRARAPPGSRGRAGPRHARACADRRARRALRPRRASPGATRTRRSCRGASIRPRGRAGPGPPRARRAPRAAPGARPWRRRAATRDGRARRRAHGRARRSRPPRRRRARPRKFRCCVQCTAVPMARPRLAIDAFDAPVPPRTRRRSTWPRNAARAGGASSGSSAAMRARAHRRPRAVTSIVSPQCTPSDIIATVLRALALRPREDDASPREPKGRSAAASSAAGRTCSPCSKGTPKSAPRAPRRRRLPRHRRGFAGGDLHQEIAHRERAIGSRAAAPCPADASTTGVTRLGARRASASRSKRSRGCPWLTRCARRHQRHEALARRASPCRCPRA